MSRRCVWYFWSRGWYGADVREWCFLEIERRSESERAGTLQPTPPANHTSWSAWAQLIVPSFLPTSRHPSVFTRCLTTSFDTHCLAVSCQLLRRYTIAQHVGQVDSVCLCTCCRRLREFSGFPFFLTLRLQYCHCQQRQGKFAALFALKSAY